MYAIIKTGGIDFVSQLATYCNSFHNETGYVQIGVIGSRTNGITSEDIDEIENDEVLKDKNDEVKTKNNEDEVNLDELIEEYNKLTNKYKKTKNDNSHNRTR